MFISLVEVGPPLQCHIVASLLPQKTALFTILSMFYQSCIQSILIFSSKCWFGNFSQKDKNKLQRVVNISSKITGLKQSSLTALYEKQVGEEGAYPHTEACPHTVLFAHPVTSGYWNHAKRHRLTSKSTTCIYVLIEVNK